MWDELGRLDAIAQADLVKSGQVSATELVEAAVARIERLNSKLNAVVTPLFEQARAQAAARHMPSGPFHGVPLLLKDFLCEVADTPYYEGMRFLRDRQWRSRADSYLAIRFRAARFIFIGKTNLPELAVSPITNSVAFGPARNPFALERTAGGSSGGSAAAVASGMVAAAHGNDGTGSIRGPASCCGLLGLKPSRGRVSLGPGRSGGLLGNIAEFVLTRSVRDAAAVLDAVAGGMPGDLFVAPPPRRSYCEELGRHPGQLRVGLMLHDAALTQLRLIRPDIPDVHPECIIAVKDTGRLLESLGCHVEESYPTALEGPTGFGSALGVIASSALAAALDDWGQRTGQTIGRDEVEPATWERAEEGRRYSAPQIHAAHRRLMSGISTIPEWWEQGYDLLVTPTLAQLPPAITTSTANLIGAFGLFTMPYNFTGQPAISIPLHWSAEGLPVGVQLVARYGREDLLFQVASLLELERPWAHHYPL